MFYAARAALLHVGQAERAMGKTHTGIIAAFSQYLVQTGLVEARYGRAFSFESNRRLTADYDIEGVSAAEAAEAMATAREFLAAVRKLIGRTEENSREPA